MWSAGGVSSSQSQLQQSAVLLQASVDFSLIVRLKLRCKPAEHANEADEEGPAPAVLQAARLLTAARGVDAALPLEVHHGSVIRVASLEDGLLELLCLKTLAAKAYKALMPLQTRLGLQLGEVKACISFKPLCPSELSDAMAMAIRKALCDLGLGSNPSDGVALKAAGVAAAGAAAKAGGQAPATAAVGAAAAAGADAAAMRAAGGKAAVEARATGNEGLVAGPLWYSQNSRTLLSASILEAAPGEVVTAKRVEWEVVVQPPSTLVLMVSKAGAIKFRPFSIASALAGTLSTRSSQLPAPLSPEDDDVAIVGDPAKLRAADRALRDAAPLCKLLPDQMPAIVRGIKATAGAHEAAIRASWLSLHAITLPTHSPYYLEVSPSDDPDAASQLVPSSCVLTPVGMTDAPPSAPEHMSGAAAVQLLAGQLEGSGVTLWGPNGLKVLHANGSGHAQSSKDVAAEGTPVQLEGRQAATSGATYTLTSGWQSAKAVLSSAASNTGGSSSGIGSDSRDGSGSRNGSGSGQAATGTQIQQSLLLANLVAVEADPAAGSVSGSGNGAGAGKRGAVGAGGHRPNYSALKQQLDRLARDRLELVGAASGSNSSSPAMSAMAGAAGPAGAAGAASNAGAPAHNKPSTAVPRKPVFARRPGAPPAAAASKAAKPHTTGHVSALRAASTPAAMAAAAARAATAAAGGGAAAGPTAGAGTNKPPAVPSFKKRPATPAAAGSIAVKPPAAKKPKAAVGAAAAAQAPAAKNAAGASGKVAGTTATLVPGANGGGVAAAASSASGNVTALTAPGIGAVVQRQAVAMAPVSATSAEGAGTAAGAAGTASPAAAGAAAPVAPPATAAAGTAAAAGAAAPARKRTKAADLDSAAVEAKVLAKAATGELKGLTAPEMQCFLRGRKLPVSGAKAVLEGRIRAALGMAAAEVSAPAAVEAAAA